MGAGVKIGKLFGTKRAIKGGLGMASLRVADLKVGALIVVNAVGDVINPDTARPIAGARTEDGSQLLGARRAIAAGQVPERLLVGTNTTIGVVTTDAVLTEVQAQKIAQMAHDGLARSINPVHTMSDGDTLFALGTGRSGKTSNPNLLGLLLGAEVMARAVAPGVRAAQGIEGYPSAADISYRLEQMKRVIFDAAQRHQVLLFTCHLLAWRGMGVALQTISLLQAQDAR